MLGVEKPVTSKRDFCKILFLSLSFPLKSVGMTEGKLRKCLPSAVSNRGTQSLGRF